MEASRRRPFPRRGARLAGPRCGCAGVRPRAAQRPHRRRHREPLVSRRPRRARRHDRANRAGDHRSGRPRDRPRRPCGRARLHRPAHSRCARHLPGADGRQLRAPGRDDHPGRPRRRIARAAQALPRQARGPAEVVEHRELPRPGIGARGGHRSRRSPGERAGARAHARAGRAGHAGRRVRPEHGPLLRAGHLHAALRSGRARKSRGTSRRRSHLAHASGRRSPSASGAACPRRCRTTR